MAAGGRGVVRSTTRYWRQGTQGADPRARAALGRKTLEVEISKEGAHRGAGDRLESGAGVPRTGINRRGQHGKSSIGLTKPPRRPARSCPATPPCRPHGRILRCKGRGGRSRTDLGPLVVREARIEAVAEALGDGDHAGQRIEPVAIAHSTSSGLRMSTSSSTTVTILSGNAAKVAMIACFDQPARSGRMARRSGRSRSRRG